MPVQMLWHLSSNQTHSPWSFPTAADALTLDAKEALIKTLRLNRVPWAALYVYAPGSSAVGCGQGRQTSSTF